MCYEIYKSGFDALIMCEWFNSGAKVPKLTFFVQSKTLKMIHRRDAKSQRKTIYPKKTNKITNNNVARNDKKLINAFLCVSAVKFLTLFLNYRYPAFVLVVTQEFLQNCNYSQDLKRNLGKLILNLIASRRVIKILSPAIVAANVISRFRYSRAINNNEPAHETVA